MRFILFFSLARIGVGLFGLSDILFLRLTSVIVKLNPVTYFSFSLQLPATWKANENFEIMLQLCVSGADT